MAKVEALNPGGSIKDRVAVALIEAAERDGKLKPGGTIVEPTSGNTGTGLAIAARLKGYRVIAVMPDKMSKEKIDLLRAYGAEVVVAPTAVAAGVARVLLPRRRAPGRRRSRAPSSPTSTATPPTRRRTTLSTGPELWEQSGGRITHLVVGVGTGGTITGTGRYLKERNPSLQVIGADPFGSIYSSPEVKPYLVEGVGEDFWPETYDPSIVDRYVTVSDRDAFLTTRRLAMVEGILAGGSGGLAVHAALEVAREISDPEALVAVILPDGGRSYLSKVYNDAWMTQHGFLERADRPDGGRRALRQAGGGRDPAAGHRRGPTRRSATPSRSCTSTASRSCRSSAPTTRVGRRLDRRARPAQARRRRRRACSTPISSTSWSLPSPRCPPATPCARRSSCWSAIVRR